MSNGDNLAFAGQMTIKTLGKDFSEISIQKANGLTKREYFACAAMQGATSQTPPDSDDRSLRRYSQDVALWSVAMADALLAELEKDEK